jgi:ABC-2 type transport system ATP-binding protein
MLILDEVSKTYSNGVKALDNISLKIDKGMFGLLGPNGAGKSSLMRTIATLQDLDTGSISFDGINVLNDKMGLRARLGYLPQEFGVYPEAYPAELLNYLAVMKGLKCSKERKQQVDELLELTNLSNHRTKKLGTFSGGMKQRFGIAQALILNPSLIIVDEPTAGLDPEERDRFLNLLSLVSDETTIILSTHIVSDISDLCPNFAIMNKGKVLLSDSPKEAIARLEGKVWIKSFDRSESNEAQKQFKTLSTRFAYGKVLLRAYADETPAPGFELANPDLEDVYFLNIKLS